MSEMFDDKKTAEVNEGVIELLSPGNPATKDALQIEEVLQQQTEMKKMLATLQDQMVAIGSLVQHKVLDTSSSFYETKRSDTGRNEHEVKRAVLVPVVSTPLNNVKSNQIPDSPALIQMKEVASPVVKFDELHKSFRVDDQSINSPIKANAISVSLRPDASLCSANNAPSALHEKRNDKEDDANQGGANVIGEGRNRTEVPNQLFGDETVNQEERGVNAVALSEKQNDNVNELDKETEVEEEPATLFDTVDDYPVQV